MVTVTVEVEEEKLNKVADYAARHKTTVETLVQEFLKETADRGERATTGSFSRRDIYRC